MLAILNDDVVHSSIRVSTWNKQQQHDVSCLTSSVGIVHLLVYLGTDKDKRRSRAARQQSKRSVERGVEVGRTPHTDQEHKPAER